jgi:hypothetical protein
MQISETQNRLNQFEKMSTITQNPDELSLSGNLKKFEITSNAEVIFILSMGGQQILNERYQPDATGLLTIDVKPVIERILEITVPVNQDQMTEQNDGVALFLASVDGVEVTFMVIKGGISEFTADASSWLNTHFLTWQPKIKSILQSQPEWIGIYPVTLGRLMIKCYMADGSNWQSNYCNPTFGRLLSINVSWNAIVNWDAGTNLIAWDIWYEDMNENVLIQPIRYKIRPNNDAEFMYVWANTIGGIDSASFTGYQEEDFKFVHQNALYVNDSILEYDTDQAREIKQSTGYMDAFEKSWISDFFYSRKKYFLRPDGNLKQITVVSSKVISINQNNEFDYEFSYRFSDDFRLLNLERIIGALPPATTPEDLVLTNTLSGLPQATYDPSLIIPVQSPYLDGWMKLSFAQLWAAALPSLVDGVSVMYVNGQLRATGIGGLTTDLWADIQAYIDSKTGGSVADSSTKLISGTIVWKSGLTFQSTDLVYKIQGTQYTSLAREITFNPADGDYSRIDLFYVDPLSNLLVATGVPSLNPSSPILPPTKLEVMLVLIEPGATAPQNIESTIIYEEADEWMYGGGTDDPYVWFSFDSSNNPKNQNLCVEMEIAVPNTVQETPLHYIGESYGGGIIFWLDSTGIYGLIAAETDCSSYSMWGNNQYGGSFTGANLSGIGDGYFNTNAMLMDSKSADYAARLCNQLNIGGITGWWLPSMGELMQMRARQNVIGNFMSAQNYWSSTETNESSALVVNFGTGSSFTAPKNTPYSVRAIRDFYDSGIPTGGTVSTVQLATTSFVFYDGNNYNIDKGILSFWMRSNKPWLPNSVITIDGLFGEGTSGTVAMNPNNHFGYNMYSTVWQMVAIPMFNFASSEPTINGFYFNMGGAWPNDFVIAWDTMKYQYGGATIPADVIVSPGIYGGPAKTLKIGVNSEGKITSVTEYPITDGAGLVEDSRFEFRDIVPETSQYYVIDLYASFGYTINSAILQTNVGTLTYLTIWINETAVTFSTPLQADTWPMGANIITAVSNNIVMPGDKVTLATDGSYTDYPTLLRGKLVTTRN